MTRVVITGIGILSPVGNGRQASWQGLVDGRSGLGPITLFDASAFPVRIGGEVKDFGIPVVLEAFPAAAACLRDRKVLLALEAARQAISDSGLEDEHLQRASLHVGVGLEMLCMEDLTPFAQFDNISHAIARYLPERLNVRLLQTPLDNSAEILWDQYGFFG